MKTQAIHIKAKDYIIISHDEFLCFSADLQAELVSHYYLFKRRRIQKSIIQKYLNSLTPEKIQAVLKHFYSDDHIKKFFRSIRNIPRKVLNKYLASCGVKVMRRIIFLIKLEDRRKLEGRFILKCRIKDVIRLLNEHFATFGKLPLQFFRQDLFSLPPELMEDLILNIDPAYRQDFLKRAGLSNLKKFAVTLAVKPLETILATIKGTITLLTVNDEEDFLVKTGRINKRNVLVVNNTLFQNMDLFYAELILYLYAIKIKQRKHIDPSIMPLFHDLKLIEYILNLTPRKINAIIAFLTKNGIKNSSFVYRYVCETKLETLKKVTSRQYAKVFQNLFDLFYDNFMSHTQPVDTDKAVFKGEIQKLLASRFIESYLEHDKKPKIPVLLPFETYLDADGRTLLGYCRVDDQNIEIRPTLKHFANSIVRFRPKMYAGYDVFKVDRQGKITDFVPVVFLLANARLQHVAAGYSVAEYVHGYRDKALTFRTYLTADSKIYFAKIDGEVIQTLISYLVGGNPIECTVGRDEHNFILDIYLIDAQTGRKIYKQPLRSIVLRREKPYFTHIAADFSTEMFFAMDKKIFNTIIPFFKQHYFCSFYDGLTIERKKDLFEKLTSKGEAFLIQQIGQEKFTDDLEQITFTYGDELDNLSELLGAKDDTHHKEYMATHSRRETDVLVPDDAFADITDNIFFVRTEANRIEEFGFDFIAYPPELTFQIKMPILRKIFESFPNELRRYIKIHADDIGDDVQEKIVSLSPRLLDGIILEKAFKVRKDPVKRLFIDEIIHVLEDRVSYDTINDIVNYLRNASIRIQRDKVTRAFMVRDYVMARVSELAYPKAQILLDGISIKVIDH